MATLSQASLFFSLISINQVEEAIMETLKHVANEGFPEERIESILHQIELSQKHVCNPFLRRFSDYSPFFNQITSDFGMTVGQAINSSWIHGTDPAEVLSINKVLSLC